MANVTESDVAVASRILHDKSKKAKVIQGKEYCNERKI